MVPRLRGSTTGEHRGTGGSDAAGGAAPTEGNVVGDGGTGGTIKTKDVIKKGGKIMGKYGKTMGKSWENMGKSWEKVGKYTINGGIIPFKSII